MLPQCEISPIINQFTLPAHVIIFILHELNQLDFISSNKNFQSFERIKYCQTTQRTMLVVLASYLLQLNVKPSQPATIFTLEKVRFFIANYSGLILRQLTLCQSFSSPTSVEQESPIQADNTRYPFLACLLSISGTASQLSYICELAACSACASHEVKKEPFPLNVRPGLKKYIFFFDYTIKDTND